MIEEGWASYPDRFGLLRQLANLDSINPVPIEKIWPALDKAAEKSPDDDRIWLGRANLAIRTGEFVKAGNWLTDCLRRGRTTHRSGRAGWTWPLPRATTAEAEQALKRSAAAASHSLTRSSTLGAWFAARSHDQERERQALEMLLENFPGKTQAVERLAELELLAGRTERSARLSARKSRAGPGEAPLRDARDEAQQRGDTSCCRNGASGRGAGPKVRGSLPLVRGPGAQVRRPGGNRGQGASGSQPTRSPRGRRFPSFSPRSARPSPVRTMTARGAITNMPAFTDDAEMSGLRFSFEQRRDARAANPRDYERGRRPARLRL